MIPVRAFPKGTESNHPEHLGMTLLDYFAATALQALLSNGWIQTGILKDEKAFEKRFNLKINQDKAALNLQEWHARSAYQFADAMMKQREQTDHAA